jgi:hypothetical protein
MSSIQPGKVAPFQGAASNFAGADTFSFRALDRGLGLGRTEAKPLPVIPVFPVAATQHAHVDHLKAGGKETLTPQRGRDVPGASSVATRQDPFLAELPDDASLQTRTPYPSQYVPKPQNTEVSVKSEPKRLVRAAKSREEVPEFVRDGFFARLAMKLFGLFVDLVAVTIFVIGSLIALRLIAPHQTEEIIATLRSPIWQTLFGWGVAIAAFSIVFLAYFLIFRICAGRTLGQMVLRWAGVLPEANRQSFDAQSFEGSVSFSGGDQLIQRAQNWPMQ